MPTYVEVNKEFEVLNLSEFCCCATIFLVMDRSRRSDHLHFSPLTTRTKSAFFKTNYYVAFYSGSCT